MAKQIPDEAIGLDDKVATFIELLDKKVSDYHHANYPNVVAISGVPKHEARKGGRYIKIVTLTPMGKTPTGQPNYGQAAYAFIDRNGDILKPAGWNAPAKHARGNVFAPDNGLGCAGVHSVAYLR